MSGREKTIKTAINIENCLNHISKGSRRKFTRQLDICFYIVNKVVKQDLRMTKIWVKGIESLPQNLIS